MRMEAKQKAIGVFKAMGCYEDEAEWAVDEILKTATAFSGNGHLEPTKLIHMGETLQLSWERHNGSVSFQIYLSNDDSINPKSTSEYYGDIADAIVLKDWLERWIAYHQRHAYRRP